eukprot:9269131-Alexandrium_andersonii.AAC.1
MQQQVHHSGSSSSKQLRDASGGFEQVPCGFEPREGIPGSSEEFRVQAAPFMPAGLPPGCRSSRQVLGRHGPHAEPGH